jgi:hypothetical protein
MPRKFSRVSIIALILLAPTAARAVDCVDYQDYIHLTGCVELPAPAHDLALANGLLYSVDERGLRIFDLADPESPSLLGELSIPGAACLALRGEHAYVGCEDTDLRTVNIGDPTAPWICDSLTIPDNAGDIELAGDFAYIAVGQAGLQILDIVDPGAPVLHTIVDTPYHALDLAIQGDYAYIADTRSLVVIDITDLPTKPLAPPTPPDRPGPSLLSVAVAGDHAYLLDNTFGLYVYDVSDPLDPLHVTNLAGSGQGGLEVVGDRLYAGLFPGLSIWDISTPAAPVEICAVNAGGLTSALALQGDLVYQTVRSPGAIDIFDLSNLERPPERGVIELSGWPYHIAMVEPYVYLASRFYGLRLVDTSDPGAMLDLGYVPGVERARQTIVEGHLAYVAGEYDGLYVLDILKPATPQILSIQPMGGSAVHMAKQGDLIHVANWNGLRIVDVSNPLDPEVIGFLDTIWDARYVAVLGDHVLLATTLELLVVDISTPTAPQVVETYNIQTKSLEIVGELAYISTIGHLDIYSVAELPALEPVGHLLLPNYCISMFFTEKLAYLAMGSGGLQIVDITDPAAPWSVGSSNYWPMGVYAGADQLYLADTSHLYALPLHCTITSVEELPPPAAGPARLHANHPNPFNPSTRISYTLAEPARVSLSIHDSRGRLLRTLRAESPQAAGRHEFIWDGRDGGDRPLASGVYFYRLEVDNQTLGESMILLK